LCGVVYPSFPVKPYRVACPEVRCTGRPRQSRVLICYAHVCSFSYPYPLRREFGFRLGGYLRLVTQTRKSEPKKTNTCVPCFFWENCEYTRIPLPTCSSSSIDVCTAEQSAQGAGGKGEARRQGGSHDTPNSREPNVTRFDSLFCGESFASSWVGIEVPFLCVF
jgi:hypothetical protein